MATMKKGRRTSGATVLSDALQNAYAARVCVVTPYRTWAQVANAMLSRGVRTNEKAVRRDACLAMRKLRRLLAASGEGE
jgi:hypothetical protein